jgi:hypothetical protein
MTIFFMHIPKTAGSSVSRLFIDHLGEERAIEQCTRGIYREWDFNSLEFVSGHLPVCDLDGRLDATAYRFTLLREPIDQLISHLNWVKRLLLPDYRKNFEQNTVEIQQVALSLAEVELSDPEAVDRYLRQCRGRARRLFLNAQASYFLPRESDCAQADLDLACAAVRSLGRFHAVGRMEDAARVIARVAADNGLGALAPLPRENVSRHKAGLQGGEASRRLLAPHMQLDMLLYEVAGQRAGTPGVPS